MLFDSILSEVFHCMLLFYLYSPVLYKKFIKVILLNKFIFEKKQEYWLLTIFRKRLLYKLVSISKGFSNTLFRVHFLKI